MRSGKTRDIPVAATAKVELKISVDEYYDPNLMFLDPMKAAVLKTR